MQCCVLDSMFQITTAIIAGLGLAAVGFAGRYVVKQLPNITSKMAEAVKKMPSLDPQSLAASKYYKGGFEQKMTRREASLILGVSPSAPKAKVKEHFKKLITANHPDRGGSPYLAAKINEAKDMLEK
uniref:J domain-containing protein n=1 Tax=Trichogramma kaykai TaxID=54128 RepID=A0ABD2XDU5_9HYME